MLTGGENEEENLEMSRRQVPSRVQKVTDSNLTLDPWSG